MLSACLQLAYQGLVDDTMHAVAWCSWTPRACRQLSYQCGEQGPSSQVPEVWICCLPAAGIWRPCRPAAPDCRRQGAAEQCRQTELTAHCSARVRCMLRLWPAAVSHNVISLFQRSSSELFHPKLPCSTSQPEWQVTVQPANTLGWHDTRMEGCMTPNLLAQHAHTLLQCPALVATGQRQHMIVLAEQTVTGWGEQGSGIASCSTRRTPPSGSCGT